MLFQRQLTGQPGPLLAGHRWRGRNSPIGKDLRPHVNKPGHRYRVSVACRFAAGHGEHADDRLPSIVGNDDGRHALTRLWADGRFMLHVELYDSAGHLAAHQGAPQAPIFVRAGPSG